MLRQIYMTTKGEPRQRYFLRLIFLKGFLFLPAGWRNISYSLTFQNEGQIWLTSPQQLHRPLKREHCSYIVPWGTIISHLISWPWSSTAKPQSSGGHTDSLDVRRSAAVGAQPASLLVPSPSPGSVTDSFCDPGPEVLVLPHLHTSFPVCLEQSPFPFFSLQLTWPTPTYTSGYSSHNPLHLPHGA